MTLFFDRQAAGRQLARLLEKFKDEHELIVIGLPRGGVAVASEVAKSLAAPLDALMVRKLGVPGNEELAMGAIADPDIRILDSEIVGIHGISDYDISRIEARERQELNRRKALYRQGRGPLVLAGKTVIIVDDGVATGATMMAAIQAARRERLRRLVVALPVAARDSLKKIRESADEVIVLATPEPFFGVGMFYQNFEQMTDADVIKILHLHPNGEVVEANPENAADLASFPTLSRHQHERHSADDKII